MTDLVPLAPVQDALTAFYADRRLQAATDALPCALQRGVRYGNCDACVLDGLLDPSDCILRCTCGPDASGETPDARPGCVPCSQRTVADIGEAPF